MCTETRIEVHKHNAPLAYGCRKAVQQLPHLQAIQYLSILTTFSDLFGNIGFHLVVF
jgi:hypothetical protein